jgi:hypothetical protein
VWVAEGSDMVGGTRFAGASSEGLMGAMGAVGAKPEHVVHRQQGIVFAGCCQYQ